MHIIEKKTPLLLPATTYYHLLPTTTTINYYCSRTGRAHGGGACACLRTARALGAPASAPRSWPRTTGTRAPCLSSFFTSVWPLPYTDDGAWLYTGLKPTLLFVSCVVLPRFNSDLTALGFHWLRKRQHCRAAQTVNQHLDYRGHSSCGRDASHLRTSYTRRATGGSGRAARPSGPRASGDDASDEASDLRKHGERATLYSV